MTGKLIGYARVSTTDQNLEIQLEALHESGAEKVFAEKITGTTTKGREQLQALLEFVREGDTVIVTRIDRLARSIGDLQDIVRLLKAKGVDLKATEQPIDTSTAAGKAFLDMLGVFSEFETNLRKERQLEGIKAAKEKGVYTGGKKIIDRQKIKQMHGEGVRITEIAKALGVSRMSVHRILGE